MADRLDLTVSVPADEWAYMQRRLAWFEALLLRIVRDRAAFPEWHDAGQLADLRLPGLPASRSAIAQKASREGWTRRAAKGRRVLFHVSSLPARAFDALIARILDLPELEAETDALFTLPTPPAPEVLAENATPAWVLPLMRLIRQEGDLAKAWRALPDHLPEHVPLPDVEDAAKMLVKLKLIKGH
ncbi:DNA-binding protein [Paracoccus limosus]|nr:DNA-binding protein [Paracoccus limosus]